VKLTSLFAVRRFELIIVEKEGSAHETFTALKSRHASTLMWASAREEILQTGSDRKNMRRSQLLLQGADQE